jgi:hypothetical protein
MRGCAPEQGLAVFVVLAHEVIDLAQQLFDAAEGAAAGGFVGDESEEVLHLIEPGTIIGRLWRPALFAPELSSATESAPHNDGSARCAAQSAR